MERGPLSLATKETEEERQYVLLLYTNSLLLCIAVVFVAIHLFIEEYWSPMFLVSCADLIAFPLVLLLLLVHNDFKGACIVFCVYVNLVLAFLGLFYPQADIWYCLLPVFTFYVFGSKVGLHCFVFMLFQSSAVFWIRTMDVLPHIRTDSFATSPLRYVFSQITTTTTPSVHFSLNICIHSCTQPSLLCFICMQLVHDEHGFAVQFGIHQFGL